jgi:hypothetical protein
MSLKQFEGLSVSRLFSTRLNMRAIWEKVESARKLQNFAEF